MGIIPKEILQFSHIFGAFPLKYTKDTKEGVKLSFSSRLYYWSLISYTLLSMAAIIYVLYAMEPPEDNSSSVALLLNSFSLSLLTIAVASSQTRKYNVFIEMCQILERIDKRLKLQTEDLKAKRKVYLVFFYTTTVLALSYAVRSDGRLNYWLYFLYRITYYVQASLFLQFTFVCNSLTRRFAVINEEIRIEAMKQHHSTTSDSRDESLQQLGVLTNCYSQLYNAVEKANSFYGSQLLPALISAFVHEISSIYLLLKMNSTKDFYDLGIQVVWVFTHTIYIFLLVLPSTAVLETAEETAPIVCGLISGNPSSSKFRKKLNMFLLQLSHYKRGFSVIGLCQVDNEVLTSLASSVTTYLVILLQTQVPNPLEATSEMTVATKPPIFTLASTWINNTTTQKLP